MKNKNIIWILAIVILVIIGGMFIIMPQIGQAARDGLGLKLYDSNKQLIKSSSPAQIVSEGGVSYPGVSYIKLTLSLQNTGNDNVNTYLRPDCSGSEWGFASTPQYCPSGYAGNDCNAKAAIVRSAWCATVPQYDSLAAQSTKYYETDFIDITGFETLPQPVRFAIYPLWWNEMYADEVAANNAGQLKSGQSEIQVTIEADAVTPDLQVDLDWS